MNNNIHANVSSPIEVKGFLDSHVVSHENAKKALAIAFCNRIRMLQLRDEDLKKSIKTNNVLLIGKTGIGKTELVKRLAEFEFDEFEFSQSPFIRSDATKFTEVGYVGKDVESLVHDLLERAVSIEKNKLLSKSGNSSIMQEAQSIVVKAVLKKQGLQENDVNIAEYLEKLKNKDLEDVVVEIETSNEEEGVHPQLETSNSGSIGYATIGVIPFNDIFKAFSGEKRKIKRLKTQEAVSEVAKNIIAKKASDKNLVLDAKKNAEENGIIFIDEFDKLISSKQNFNRGDVSREGVQRDLLSIIDGSIVQTKYGPVDTSHILFIASGAFYHAKFSDLLPELQGRFPIKVLMKNLGMDDFVKIMTMPKYNLLRQVRSLIEVENIMLDFTPDGIEEIARTAHEINSLLDDIGARRLNSVVDRVIEEISFNSKEYRGKTIHVDKEYVAQTMKEELERIENKKESYIL